MERMGWVRKEIERAKILEHKNVVGDSDKDEAEKVLNTYVGKILDSALELAEVFAKQNHSGQSAAFTADIFQKLVAGIPLSPIAGEEEEWERISPNIDVDQNQRCWALFREKKPGGGYAYRYGDIMKITNEDEIWQRWSEPGRPGVIDDQKNPAAKLYFTQRKQLMDSLNESIKLPFIPITYIYEYDFKDRAFKEKGTR